MLIFDEVKVGCRIAPGGATELFGVTPDLVTLAKAIGGGVSGGRFEEAAELMERISPLGPTIHFGTYNANPLGMAAGLACLQQVMTENTHRGDDAPGHAPRRGAAQDHRLARSHAA